MGESQWCQLVIPSDPAKICPVQDQIANQLDLLPFKPRRLAGIMIALEESLINAIKHGNRSNRDKNIVITYQVTVERFAVRISDEGDGFDHADLPDPTAANNLERTSGRGILVMQHYMTEVRYNERGNSVEMTRDFGIHGDAS